jgi:uncharacterized protein GlcG (DUF336 family)
MIINPSMPSPLADDASSKIERYTMSHADSRAKPARRILTNEIVACAVEAAEAKARSAEHTISVAVVDDSGNLVFFSRGEECGYITFETAKGKAALSAGFRIPAKDLVSDSVARAAFWASVSGKLGVVVTGGGYPLTIDGVVIGGVGCGGGHGPQDEDCARVAAEAVNS